MWVLGSEFRVLIGILGLQWDSRAVGVLKDIKTDFEDCGGLGLQDLGFICVPK